MIKNLSQLKKALQVGAQFEIVAHCRPEVVGQIRKVTCANTQGFYTFIPDAPTDKVSIANGGKGSWLDWGNASLWKFEGDIVSRCDVKGNLIIKMKMLDAA